MDSDPMEIVLLIVGLIFAACGMAVVLSEARARRGSQEAPARVIGFATGKGASDGPSYRAVAELVGVDGRTRYVEASVGSSSPLCAVGDTVTVLLHPDDADRVAIKSALSYVLGIVFALLGAGACVAFFALFRLNTFSIASASAVVAVAAYKLRGTVREQPMSLKAWREYKDKALRPRVFTEETKGEIAWADPALLDAAARKQQKANRFGIPLLFLAGAGLLLLGGHLYRRTEAFLAKAVHAPGVVVDLERRHSSDGADTFAPVVEFEHEGRRFRFADSVSSRPASYRAGDRVGVLYDPANPRDARIDRGRWNRAIPIFVGCFGLLFCAAGLLVVKKRSTSRAG
jgi:hypothetical protein